jgi:hypothetical protein
MRIQLNVGTQDVLDERIEDDGGEADADFGFAVEFLDGSRVELNREDEDGNIRFVAYTVQGMPEFRVQLAYANGEWAVVG